MLVEPARRVAKPQHIPKPSSWSSNGITAAWLGHATVLINFYGINILTDPTLYPRIGASLKMGTVGPKRFIAPPLPPSQLPKIDLVLLSHAHLDHMDLPSLHRITPEAKVVTAHATSDILRHTRFSEINELGWGKKDRLKFAQGDLEIEAIEVRHWGARWRCDKFRGYNGYILSREGKKVLFGGDTAMCGLFKPLQAKGPFELTVMPIGAYKHGFSWHCTPEEAVWMSNVSGSRYVLPIHHSTFPLGQHPRFEPIQRFEAAIEPERIAVREVGETFALPA